MFFLLGVWNKHRMSLRQIRKKKFWVPHADERTFTANSHRLSTSKRWYLHCNEVPKKKKKKTSIKTTKKHRKRIENPTSWKVFLGFRCFQWRFLGNFPAAIRFPKTRRKLPKAHAQRMEAICRAVKSGVLRTGPVVFGWRSLAP